LADLDPPPDEIVVVYQTAAHPESVTRRLDEIERRAPLRRIRRERPSIPGAMNDGLVAARGDLVVFCDDDVVPEPDFVTAHRDAHRRNPACIVAGQVLQPGESREPLVGDAFSFRSSVEQTATEVIGCNFSVPRARLIELGGFDERFVAAAYRYERELCDRARRAGMSIRFVPAASLRHLRASRGGTRAWGDHLRTFRPGHSVGEYYYLVRASGTPGRFRQLLGRPWRAVRTRHHLRRPWWIPATLLAELLGFFWALALAARGPFLLDRREAAA
jgi:GT2 family glycosyltransferase